MVKENLVDILKSSLDIRIIIRNLIEENYPGFFSNKGLRYYFDVCKRSAESLVDYITTVKLLKILSSETVINNLYNYFKNGSEIIMVYSGVFNKGHYNDLKNEKIKYIELNPVDFIILIEETLKVKYPNL